MDSSIVPLRGRPLRRNCTVCGTEFLGAGGGRYCSDDCKVRARACQGGVPRRTGIENGSISAHRKNAALDALDLVRIYGYDQEFSALDWMRRHYGRSVNSMTGNEARQWVRMNTRLRDHGVKLGRETVRLLGRSGGTETTYHVPRACKRAVDKLVAWVDSYLECDGSRADFGIPPEDECTENQGVLLSSSNALGVPQSRVPPHTRQGE